MGNPTNADHWASRERLRTVERALWWRGWVGRRDLMELYGISAAQASGDLQRYLEMNPGSMLYHTSRKRYEAAPGGRWVLTEPVFEEGLAAFFSGGIRIFPGQIGDGDAVAGVGLPDRKASPEIARGLSIAALANHEVEVDYLSVTSGKAGWRVIAPHAFGHDGYRWHARAWCAENGDYRDFVISRMKRIKWPRPLSVGDLPPDEDWGTMETIRLKPHRKLSAQARRAIELDYGIPNDGELTLQVRRAMKNYLLAHLRVDQAGLPRHFEMVDGPKPKSAKNTRKSAQS